MNKEEMRENVDFAIRNLWIAYAILSDFAIESDENILTNEDFDLWEKVTNHSAIQSRLSEGK